MSVKITKKEIRQIREVYDYICDFCNNRGSSFSPTFDYPMTGWQEIRSITPSTEEVSHMCPVCYYKLKEDN